MEKCLFREVLCPHCFKPYMAQIFKDYDCSVRKDGQILNGWFSGCPKCDGRIFIVENVYKGEDLDKCEIVSGITIR